VQASTALFTAALTLVLLRILGSHGYGLFALALAVGSLVVLPADLGLSASTARFLAESRHSGAATRSTLATGFRLKAAASLLVAAGLFGLSGPIAAGYGERGLVWPLRGMALAVIGQGIMRFCVASFSARQRNALSFLVVAGESFAETVASIAVVAAGGGAAGAAFGRAVGYAVGATLGIAVLSRVFRMRPSALVLSPAEPGTSRRIATYAAALAVADGVWAAFNQVDILLIGAFLSATAAGIFQAPLRLLAVLAYPGIALGAALGPRLARTGRGQKVDPGPLVAAARGLLVAQVFVSGTIVALAVPIATFVFGSGYAHSAGVLAALAPYIALGGLAPLFSNAIDYIGATRRRVRIGAVALAANIVLDVILIPAIGVVGAAVGTDAGYAIYVVGQIVVAADLLGFPVEGLVSTLLRSLAAGVPMTAILAVGVRLGPPGIAAALLVGPATFAAVLHVTGETAAQPWLRRGPELAALLAGRIRRAATA
jgi:O-antigen/teichoic acid export membrane protein